MTTVERLRAKLDKSRQARSAMVSQNDLFALLEAAEEATTAFEKTMPKHDHAAASCMGWSCKALTRLRSLGFGGKV